MSTLQAVTQALRHCSKFPLSLGSTYFSQQWTGQPMPLCFPLSHLLSMIFVITGRVLLIQSAVSYHPCLSLCVLCRDEALPSLTQVKREDDIYALPPLQAEEKNR